MLKGGGAETETLGNRGGRGGNGSGTHCLRTPSHNGTLFQVPGVGPVGVRQRLARGDSEFAESAAEMSAPVTGD